MKLEILKSLRTGLLGLACSNACLAAELSEQDYFSELPTVLTVSRLAQPISETPGAVTVIDRETIRRSGARELADVLRLVPGYLVDGFNGANPVAAYHVPLDSYGIRNLVLVDGRPVYSGYYIGDTHRGMMGVLLEDIERIEVLRGSNSAAYGANAMFGVINIITRHTLDTRGGEVSVTGGEGGVWDNMARIGWGNETASFRLSAGRRSDSGYRNAHDDKIVSQLHLRGDLRPAPDQELMLAAGVSQIATGDGFAADVGNPLRTIEYRDAYLHGQWRRQLSETDELKLTANFDEEKLQDAFVYALDPSVTVSTSGRGRRINLELQHQLGMASSLRAVWGAGYKYEEAKSPALYATGDAVSFHEERLFGNLEWRPHPQWLINAGGFFGHHSRVGNYFSPRLMANFHVAPDHTLRIGASKSTRTPAIYELASDVRFYPKNSRNWPLPLSFSKLTDQDTVALFSLLNLPVRTVASTGTVNPEKLITQEIGYFGNFTSLRMTMDIRAYIESVKDIISDDATRVIPGYISGILPPPYPPLPYDVPLEVGNFQSSAGFKVRGIEYQLRWKPLEGTEIWLNQNFQNLIWDATASNRTIKLPPQRATTLALFQKLPDDFELSVMYHTMGAMSWGGERDALPSRNRLDARLAKTFRIGSTRAEAAFAVQAANGAYPEYLARKNFTFERRAFGSLRLEF